MSKNKINTTAATAASAESTLIEVKSKVRPTLNIKIPYKWIKNEMIVEC